MNEKFENNENEREQFGAVKRKEENENQTIIKNEKKMNKLREKFGKDKD